MNRAFFVLLLVGLQLLSLTPNRTSAAEDLTPVIKKTQGAVAQVVCYDVEGKIFKYGSGFFVSPEGQFVTSRNLVLGASKAVIKMGDLREFPVKAVLAENKSTELVKLLIEPAGNLWPVFVVTEKMPDLGARVLALGYNRKTQLSVMEGMVSGVQDFLSFGKVIQISAHVTPAGSGGPVVNLQGEVIGVGRSGKSEGQDFNFAISGAQVRALQPGLPQPFEEWASSRLDEAVTLHLTRGSQYLKAGRSEEALLAYRQATRIKTQTGSAPAHYELGMAYLKTNKVPEAQKELQVLTKLDARLAEKLEASIAAAASGTEEARLPELIKKVKPAVLFVQVYDKQDRPSRFGSAFFINAKGHFITNYHVLQGAFQAKVKTSTGKIYQVTRILAEDRDADLIMAAVVPEVEMPYLQVVGTLPQIGERVLVVGNPKGLELTAADGIVSAIRGRQKKMIQISAPISPGSSGSPLLNLKGQVIGVNTLMVTEGQMLNFASASQNILAMKRAPGLSLKERAEGWEAEANEYLKQGRKAMKAKNYRQALQFLEEGKKTCPDLPEIYYYLCLLHLTLGNEREFAAALSSLNQLDPEMARNLVARINAAQSKKGR